MVAPIYTNRKGIYRDLYREIDSDNKKRKASQTRKPRKGIYVELYKQIGFKNNEHNNKQSNLHVLALKQVINDIICRISYLFSSATGRIKMLMVACLVAKEPINNYIESNLDIYSNSELNQGIYCND